MHEDILKIVLDNGGVIAGGYVREWVRFGEPQEKGWSDIDVFCEKIESKIKIYKELSAIGVESDFRATPPFNDFFCNCWMFDGKIRLVEPKDKKYSEYEIREQTINSQAKMMKTAPIRSDKILFFQKNNWTLFTPDGSCPDNNFWKVFLSTLSVSHSSFQNNPFKKNKKFHNFLQKKQQI